MFYCFMPVHSGPRSGQVTSRFHLIRWIFLGFIFGLNVASSVALAEPLPAESAAISPLVEDAAVVAEPISPDTVQRYPHLQPFIGNILLGTPNLQVVLTGVPAVVDESPWQRAIEAVFVWQSGSWQRQSAFPGLDLQGSKPVKRRSKAARGEAALPSPTSLQALSVDIGKTRDPAAAYASFIYRYAGAPQQQLITWRLSAAGDRLSVSYGDQGPPALPARSGTSPAREGFVLQLRLHGQAPLLMLGPSLNAVSDSGGFALRHVAGASAAILGYQNLVLAAGSDPVLTMQAEAGPPVLSGFEFLLTPTAVATAWSRAAFLRSCLYGVDQPRRLPSAAATLDWLEACNPEPKTGALALVLAEPPSRLVLPTYIFSAKGQLMQVLLLGADQRELVVSLPPGSGYQLGDTPFGRRLASTVPFTVTAGATTSVTLAPRWRGQLEVTWPHARPAAALLQIEATTGDDANDHVLDELGSEPPLSQSGQGVPTRIRLSPHSWLVSLPPMRATLLAGHYRITVISRARIICRQTIEVAADHLFTLNCPAIKPSPLPPALVFADLSQRDSTPLGGLGEAKQMLAQALGIDLISADAGFTAVIKSDAGKAAAAQAMPLLGVTHAGQSLYFWPATTALAKRWELALQQSPADPVRRLARFLHDEQASGVIELGCPRAGATQREYKAQVDLLKPTALRLIGCRSETATPEEWLALWAQLAQGAVPPLLLTTDANAALADGQAFTPRLSFEGALAPGRPGLVEALLKRPFNVSFGAALTLRKLQPASRNAGKNQGQAAGGFDLSFSMTLARPSQVIEIIVFTERGKLKRALLPASSEGNQLVSVTNLNTGSATWLRIEVRGMSAGLLAAPAGRAAGNTLLAASQFVSIASLRGESP